MLGMWSRCASDSVYVASIYLDVVWYCMTRGRKKAINGFLSSDFKKKAAQFPRFIPGREVVPTSVQVDFALSVHPKPRSLSDLRFVYLLFVSASALSLVVESQGACRIWQTCLMLREFRQRLGSRDGKPTPTGRRGDDMVMTRLERKRCYIFFPAGVPSVQYSSPSLSNGGAACETPTTDGTSADKNSGFRTSVRCAGTYCGKLAFLGAALES